MGKTKYKIKNKLIIRKNLILNDEIREEFFLIVLRALILVYFVKCIFFMKRTD